MGLYESTFDRVPLDRYFTPEWVTEALLPHLGRGSLSIWEPCCGNGQVSRVLANAGHRVISSDIAPVDDGLPIPGGRMHAHNFLTGSPDLGRGCHGIVTNPPYGRGAPEFVRRALDLTRATGGFVAMLLPMNWDTASTRRDLFADHPAFAKKIVLTKRIVWFDKGGGEAPKGNHAWYMWDWSHRGTPVIAYSTFSDTREPVTVPPFPVTDYPIANPFRYLSDEWIRREITGDCPMISVVSERRADHLLTSPA